MNQLVSANSAQNLYWFGRYIERIEATMLEIIKAFDNTIDKNKDCGRLLYQNFGINLNYKTSSEFLEEAIFGDHSANLYNTSSYARENAIISRTYIDAKAFGAVIELHNLFEHASKSAFSVDFRFIDEVLAHISEIWGELSQRMNRRNSDYFIRLGRMVEKVDLHLRNGKDKEFVLLIMDEIDAIVDILSEHNAPAPRSHRDSDTNTLLQSINAKIDKIIVSNHADN